MTILFFSSAAVERSLLQLALQGLPAADKVARFLIAFVSALIRLLAQSMALRCRGSAQNHSVEENPAACGRSNNAMGVHKHPPTLPAVLPRMSQQAEDDRKRCYFPSRFNFAQ